LTESRLIFDDVKSRNAALEKKNEECFTKVSQQIYDLHELTKLEPELIIELAQAKADLEKAQADLNKAEAGNWQFDIKQAKFNYQAAFNRKNEIQTNSNIRRLVEIKEGLKYHKMT
jgi:hypothetical protein